jgi:hypothetical protein
MKWLLLILAAIAAVILTVCIVGAMLPRKHVASRRVVLRRKPIEVYAVVRDFAALTSWRSDVPRVELLDSREGRVMFREETRHGAVTYCLDEDLPGARLVLRIVDENLPYGGRWTFEFRPTADGATDLRITEDGFVKNVVFRFLAHFVFAYTATMETYLRALGKKFGEEVTPEP